MAETPPDQVGEGSGGSSRPKSSKSVRWTGRDEHREHHAGPSQPSDVDYFNFSGASGNRRLAQGYLEGEDSTTDSSGGSDDDDDDDDDDDESTAHVRATTRANTWFNRLRNNEDLDQASETEDETTGRPLIPPRQSIPSIEVSPAASTSQLSNVMDIGSKRSGGLAAGGAEMTREDLNDPLDDEYRERRNRLLASAGVRSQPASPSLEPVDPSNIGAIPLSSLSPFDQPPLQDDQSSNHPGPDAAQAALLRRQLDEKQSAKGSKDSRLISSMKGSHLAHLADSDSSSVTDRSPSIDPQHSDHENPPANPRKLSGASKEEEDAKAPQEDDNEAELKELEEQARREAQEQAKQLVKSHLAANLLKSKNDGYVDNPFYQSEMIPEDHPLDASQNVDHEGEDEKKDKGSTSSNATLEAEKDTEGDEKADGSDTDTDSDDEEAKTISLRGDPDYVPPPKKVKEGVLGSLLRLYAGQEEEQLAHSAASSATPSPNPSPGGTPVGSPVGSPSVTPSDTPLGTPTGESKVGPGSGNKKWKRPGYFRTQSSEDALGRESKNRPKWYRRSSNQSTPSLGQLAASGLATAGGAAAGVAASSVPGKKPGHSRTTSNFNIHELASGIGHTAGILEQKGYDEISALRDKEARKRAKKLEQQKKEEAKKLKKARLAEQKRITVHIADVLQRQRFILRLGRALMLFGAPSHRLEDYLTITARVLEIDGQFLYMPGCMLISFGDATTHTSETKLLKVTQGLNLHKLDSTHLIYKEVVHDMMSLEEASSHIDHLLRSKNLYPWYLVVLFYGLACVAAGMYSFGGHWQDMPIIFGVGLSVGFLQFWVQPRSDLYANVFEVSSSIVVSFLGRAFGSIGHDDNSRVFCFAAIVQGSLALILPGYIILVGALELQTRNLVAGSVRMFYANIYSLFLSFGITLGSAIYGWIDKGATGETRCHRHINDLWKILFVPMGTFFMALVNQAGLRQLGVMVIVGCSGYTAQYFVQRKVKDAASFTSAIGAFTIGILGNLYSRVGHGLAFAAMLPGIFTLVPSGVAAQGSLVAGVAVANAIVKATNSSDNSTSSGSPQSSGAAISELGNSMTQVAVGIAVGLFAATLVVYPLGLRKKRSGLFTF